MTRWALVGAIAGAMIFGVLLAWGMVRVADSWLEERYEHVRAER